ncbi:MAG: hypothetical protein V9E94_09355 [Microthrixaceae bacterium]
MFNPPAVHADAGSVRAVDLPPVPPRDAPLARTALALVPVGVAGVVAATGIIAIGWSVALVMAALVSSAALLTALVVTPLRGNYRSRPTPRDRHGDAAQRGALRT